MRIPEIDWLSVVAIVPTYARMTRIERAVFIGSLGAEPAKYPEACVRLADLALCEWTGKHLRITKSARHLHGLLRLATRQNWDDPQAAVRYIQQEFSTEERRAMVERLAGMDVSLPVKDGSARRCGELLATATIAKSLARAVSWRWSDLNIGTPVERENNVWLGKIRACGQGLLRDLLAGRNQIGVIELFETSGDPRCVAWMLAWLTQHAAVVPGITDSNLNLVVGLAPNSLPTAIPTSSSNTPSPASSTPSPASSHPTLMHTTLRVADATALVASVANQAVHINRNHKLGRREGQRLEQALATLTPEEQLLAPTLSGRLNEALQLSQVLKLIVWRDDSLLITPDGQTWLTDTNGTRQHRVVNYYRTGFHTLDMRDAFTSRGLANPIFTMFLSSPLVTARTLASLVPRLAELGTKPYELATAIPWLVQSLRNERIFDERVTSLVQLEEVGQIISMLLFRLLAPVGGATYGITAGQISHVAITPVGRYLLGLDDTWPAPVETVVERPLLIQADHSVVFLAPSPAWEVELARIAARVPGAYGTGTLFRLDKTVTQQATAAKLIAADFLERLDAVVAKPIPANVVRELRGWMDSIRRITVREATLIDCADEDTGHLVAAAAKGAKHLGGGVVLLAVDADRAAVLRKLKTLGIYA